MPIQTPLFKREPGDNGRQLLYHNNYHPYSPPSLIYSEPKNTEICACWACSAPILKPNKRFCPACELIYIVPQESANFRK
jgi:hypothetical protein